MNWCFIFTSPNSRLLCVPFYLEEHSEGLPKVGETFCFLCEICNTRWHFNRTKKSCSKKPCLTLCWNIICLWNHFKISLISVDVILYNHVAMGRARSMNQETSFLTLTTNQLGDLAQLSDHFTVCVLNCKMWHSSRTTPELQFHWEQLCVPSMFYYMCCYFCSSLLLSWIFSFPF